MGRVQQIIIKLKGFGDVLGPPPGHPKLWNVLNKALAAPVQCKRYQGLQIEWPDKMVLPRLSDWKEALAFEGVHDVELRDNFQGANLLLRRIGTDPDSMESLARLWLRFQRKIPSDVYLVRGFEFYINHEPLVEAELSDSFKQGLDLILRLQEKAGIFSPGLEETAFFPAGAPLAWPRLARSASEESLTPLDRHYEITEFIPQPREVKTTHVGATLRTSLLKVHDKASSSRMGLGPINFLVSPPKNPDSYSTAEKFRYKCESIAALYGRSIGLITFRSSSQGTQILEVMPSIPLNVAWGANLKTLNSPYYLVGPWDSRNTFMERQVEFWVKKLVELRKGALGFEVLDGQRNWSVFTDKQGNPHKALAPSRTRQHRLLLLKTEDLNLAIELGLSVNLALTETLVESNLSEAVSASKLIDLSWKYPDPMAPTYGFDKVSRHPEEFMIKVAYREPLAAQWHHEVKFFSSGDRFRSVLQRTTACLPLDKFCWSDGSQMWAQSIATSEGRMGISPKAAGLAAVDLAVRGLVALGAQPRDGIASVWISLPEKYHRTFESAYVMCLQGVAEGLAAYGFKLEVLNGSGYSYDEEIPELFVSLRSRQNFDAAIPVPGFRMSGELLYAVGPRPTFMEAGSRLLAHMNRVDSNHIFELDCHRQLEFYDHIHNMLGTGVINCLRPISAGGSMAALTEMAIWANMGAQMRPGLSPMELFSGAPGRMLIGVLPQSAKEFEKSIRPEWLITLGSSGGSKIYAVALEDLLATRGARI